MRELSFDYCFPGDETGYKVTVLVGKERETGITMASVVLVKGTSGQCAALKVLGFIKELGVVDTTAEDDLQKLEKEELTNRDNL